MCLEKADALVYQNLQFSDIINDILSDYSDEMLIGVKWKDYARTCEMLD